MDNTIKMQEIMERIKIRRQELKFSYQDLADKTNLSKSTLQRYETGGIKNMPLDRLEIIAKALEVDPYYLMGWDFEEIKAEVKATLRNSHVPEDSSTLYNNFNRLDSLGKRKLIDYSNDLVATGKYSLSKEEIAATKENSIANMFNTVAAHDDDLTQEEKTEMDNRIINAISKIKK